ncbi:MAG: MBL fold metallo-hydrolase [Eubacterium sp.]|nr:MBL fold metallo-hydrolase [Eubacterium sp.]
MKKLICGVLAAVLTAGLFAGYGKAYCSENEVLTDNSKKPATEITADLNSGWYNLLDFNDKKEFDNATRGLLATTEKLEITNADGEVIWSVDPSVFEGEAPDTANPSLWRDSQLNAYNGLFEVCDGIYQVRGYDMANLTLIRSDHGYIVYDCTMCSETAQAGLALAEQELGDIKITAVIISHPHVDHYGGVGGLISKDDVGDPSMSVDEQIAAGKVPIIVPAGFAEAAIAENVYAGHSMGRRAQYQYGVMLEDGGEGALAMGIGMGQSTGLVTYYAPTYEVTSDETLVIDGVETEFMLTPETEAPAEMNSYFPQYKALWMAENCTGTLHNLYTLRGAQVRDGLAWSNFIVEACRRYSDKTDVTFSSHNWPHWNPEIEDFLLNTAAIYKFIHDQSLHYINQGYTENEIAAMITLPDDLEKVWYTRQYYGTVKHDAKAVYQRYMGWYDANPVDLDPLPEAESAGKLMEYLGLDSPEAVIEKAKEDFEKGEYQWVAQIMKEVVYADPENQDARNLCADALEQLGYQTESGTWRNAYLTGAYELRNGNSAAALAGGMMDTISEWTVRMMFDNAAVSADADKAQHDDVEFNLTVTDLNEDYHVRRVDGVLLLFDGHRANAETTVSTTKNGLAQALLMQKYDDLEIDGDQTVMERLLAYNVTFPGDFNIIEP